MPYPQKRPAVPRTIYCCRHKGVGQRMQARHTLQVLRRIREAAPFDYGLRHIPEESRVVGTLGGRGWQKRSKSERDRNGPGGGNTGILAATTEAERKRDRKEG